MINPLDMGQEVYERMQESQDASTLVQTIYDGIKHEYTGTIDELRQQIKLGFLKWINQL